MQYNYEANQEEVLNGRTMGYVTTSAVLHALLGLAVLTFNVVVPQFKAPPVTEIEIIGALPDTPEPSSPLSSLSPPSVKTETSQSPSDASSDIVVKKSKAPLNKTSKIAPLVAKKSAPTKPSKNHGKTLKPSANPVKSIGGRRAPPIFTAPESEIAVEEFKVDEFEKELEAPVAVDAGKWSAKEIESDLNKIDNESKAQLAAVEADLDRQNQSMVAEAEGKFAALKKENQMQSEALATAIATRQASILGSDKARADGSGAGSGSAAGGEIRALSELKQMPGNVKPQYDLEDRFRRRQGEIVFLAYISEQGNPSQFKLVRGTGHRSLDIKTLKALKKWRFYPGQQGWVEIPFKWDLVGGAQEMPATLRR